MAVNTELPDQPRVPWCSRRSSGRPTVQQLSALLADGTSAPMATVPAMTATLLGGWMAVRAKNWGS